MTTVTVSETVQSVTVSAVGAVVVSEPETSIVSVGNATADHAHLRAKIMLPRGLTSSIETSSLGPLPTGGTTAWVGAVEVVAPISVNSINWRVALASVGAGQVVRIALYTSTGATNVLDVTDAVGIGTGLREVAVSPSVVLQPGIYYVLICSSTDAASSNVGPVCWNIVSAWHTSTAGAPRLTGTYTIVAGAAPATIDPTLITSGAARTLAVSLYGET